MKSLFVLTALLFCVPLTVVHAQDEPVEVETVETTVASEDPVDQNAETPAATEPESSDADALEKAKESASDLVNDAKVRVGDFANTLDQNRTVQDVSTSILNPIYVAAESIAFPAFHWIAFALMAAGVVSYAFQLVFGKLIVLTKGSINIREIISDSVGLLISGIGLILTTQAATENSTFPDNPTGVLSAAAAGVVLGLILYRWNQAEEVDAAHGRRRKKKRTQK
jgi:hypothetical protein